MKIQDVEVVDRSLEDDDLGILHVVSFAPISHEPSAHMILPNSLSGHVLHPDGFGLPFSLAEAGMSVHYVEFPASGFSTWPENPTLRRDYSRYGSECLGDSVAEVLLENQSLLELPADQLTIGGFSLGAIRAATLLPGFGEMVSRYVSADSAGFGTHPTLDNIRRYRKHLQSGAAAFRGSGESVEMYFRRYSSALQQFKKEYGPDFENRKSGLITKGFETRSLFDAMHGHTIKNIKKNILGSRPHNLELRVGFAGRTICLNKVVVEQANDSFEGLETAAQERGSSLTIGIVQGGWFGEWHDQAREPRRFRRLLSGPIESMAPRLEHIYAP